MKDFLAGSTRGVRPAILLNVCAKRVSVAILTKGAPISTNVLPSLALTERIASTRKGGINAFAPTAGPATLTDPDASRKNPRGPSAIAIPTATAIWLASQELASILAAPYPAVRTLTASRT